MSEEKEIKINMNKILYGILFISMVALSFVLYDYYIGLDIYKPEYSLNCENEGKFEPSTSFKKVSDHYEIGIKYLKISNLDGECTTTIFFKKDIEFLGSKSKSFNAVTCNLECQKTAKNKEYCCEFNSI